MGQKLNIAEQCAVGLRDISLFLHEKAKCRLEEMRERERRIFRGLKALQRLWEWRPFDSELKEWMIHARQEIKELEERRHDF